MNLRVRTCIAAIVLMLISALAALGQDASASSSSDQQMTSDQSSSSVPETKVASDDTSLPPGAAEADSHIKQLGTAFPLHMDPGGYRIGPVHLVDVSSSGFYNTATPQQGPSQSYWGTSVASDFAYTRKTDRGVLAIQGNPVVTMGSGSAYFNTDGSLDYVRMLSPRWTMNASAAVTFYQNEFLLQTPQYLLAYAAGGLVLQHLYVQQKGSTIFESNSLSFNYQLSGRTQLSLSPNIGLSLNDVDGSALTVGQLGGGATLTHSFTPERSGFVYTNVTRAYSTQAQSNGSNAWNTSSIGGGFTQSFQHSLFLSASLGASSQQGIGSHWLPTGSLSVMKTFHDHTISAAYSRSTAAQTLLSSGYFDQVDISYISHFGQKFSTSVGIGAFRSIETTSHNHGRRAYASFGYHWRPNLVWSLGYSYSDQTSTQTTAYNGMTSGFRIGLNWTLGHPGTR